MALAPVTYQPGRQPYIGFTVLRLQELQNRPQDQSGHKGQRPHQHDCAQNQHSERECVAGQGAERYRSPALGREAASQRQSRKPKPAGEHGDPTAHTIQMWERRTYQSDAIIQIGMFSVALVHRNNSFRSNTGRFRYPIGNSASQCLANAPRYTCSGQGALPQNTFLLALHRGPS
jgi:hypothetical protein